MLVSSRAASAFVLAAALALSAPSTPAQCGPDNLQGPCCQPAMANIPQIPGFQMDCRWICYNGCVITQNALDCVNLGPLLPSMSGGAIQCGVYDFRFRIKTCGTANFLWNGSMKAFYSRTWNEFPVAGATPVQVWRFVINGDLIPTALLPLGLCRRPACLNNYTRVYFSGYIDYAFDCAAGTWSVAFAVSHECDPIHHAPGTSRPAPAGGAHPTRSFSIVGPGTGFVPSVAGPRSDGPITSDAFRWNSWAPAPGALCMTEEPVQPGGIFVAGNEFCYCVAAGPQQYINTTVGAGSTCASAVSPDPNFPNYYQKRIGGWTNPAVFPGLEFALFDFGRLRYVNGCNMAVSLEWFEGGETIGGWMAVDLAGLLMDPEFEDLASCNNSKTNPAVKIGAPHISNYMLQFNLP